VQLEEGVVIPHGMGMYSSSMSGYERTINDVSLRLGRVVAAYPPTDSTSVSKKFVEYDVEVNYANQDGPYIKTIYSHCIVSSLFGGVADYVRWTPRIANLDKNSQLSYAARVLILCVNGNSRFGYIVGGVPNPDTKQTDQVFEGNNNFQFEFNGIHATIDSEGNLVILHKGATNADGSTVNTQDNGYFAINDDNMAIAYNNGPGSPSIILSKSQNRLQFNADHYLGEFDDLSISVNTSFKINDGNEQFLNGTTYRSNESGMNQNIQTALNALAATISAAGGSLTLAAPLLLIPIVGPMLASVPVAAAAASLTSAGPLFTNIAIAINIFESISAKYLSNVCYFDDGTSPVQLFPEAQAVEDADDNEPDQGS
jgi:hypothetical protein